MAWGPSLDVCMSLRLTSLCLFVMASFLIDMFKCFVARLFSCLFPRWTFYLDLTREEYISWSCSSSPCMSIPTFCSFHGGMVRFICGGGVVMCWLVGGAVS